MGWKNVRDYYRIEHIVHARKDKIVIGSSHIPSCIEINADGTLHKRYSDTSNPDLKRYQAEFDADPEKLSQLITAPDTFSRFITVYTYSGSSIIEKKCEELGYPNVTHDGDIMYNNVFSDKKSLVVQWAQESARIGMEWAEAELVRAEQELIRAHQELSKCRSIMRALDANYRPVTVD